MAVDEIRKALVKDIEKKLEPGSGFDPNNLAMLSPWFSSFSDPPTGGAPGENPMSRDLFMPSMPSVHSGFQDFSGGLEEGVRVVGFGRTISLFSSKQMPKKLEIFGDDFK